MKVHPSTAKSWARRFYAGASVADIIDDIADTPNMKFLLSPAIRSFVEQAIRDYPPTEAERKKQRANDRKA